MHASTEAGRVVGGRYRLRETIGRGAMGTVWRAKDELLDRDVAVKEMKVPPALSEDDRQALHARTFREAKTAARLSHPGVVTVFDVVEEDGRPWIVMELVQARSLDQVLAEDGPLPPRRAADVGQQLVGALATAHAAGVLHRDVKPSNVLLAPDGRAVLTDFGIATFEGDAGLTQTGMVMGTPAFTSPERIRGEPATPSSDLWSLGATLYAAVQGRGPYQERGGAITTMNAVINEDAPAAPSAGQLGPVIAALLHRDPAARPSAAAAAKLLSGAISGAAPAATPVTASGTAPGMAAGAPPGAGGGAVPGAARMAGTGYAGPAGRAPAYVPPARSASPYLPPGRPASPYPPSGQPASPAGSSGQPYSPPRPRAGAAGRAQPVPMPAAAAAAAAVSRTAFDLSLGAAPTYPPYSPPGSGSSPGAGAGATMPVSGVPPHFGTADPRRRGSPRPRPRHTVRRVVIAVCAAAAIVVAGLLVGLAAKRNAGDSLAAGTRGQPPPSASAAGHPATSSPAAAGDGTALPAGYDWYSQSAASTGTAAGFRLAVPQGWNVSRSGLTTYLRDPGGGGFMEVDLTSQTFPGALAEARWLEKQTRSQGKFPGYRRISLRPTAVLGASGAVWSFSWLEPGAGRVVAQDYLFNLSTSDGTQSYALYGSAPLGSWPAGQQILAEALDTFQPLS